MKSNISNLLTLVLLILLSHFYRKMKEFLTTKRSEFDKFFNNGGINYYSFIKIQATKLQYIMYTLPHMYE